MDIEASMESMVDTMVMSVEHTEKRRMILELSGEEVHFIVELKVKLLREGQTLKKFVLTALREKLAHDKKK